MAELDGVLVRAQLMLDTGAWVRRHLYRASQATNLNDQLVAGHEKLPFVCVQALLRPWSLENCRMQPAEERRAPLPRSKARTRKRDAISALVELNVPYGCPVS